MYLKLIGLFKPYCNFVANISEKYCWLPKIPAKIFQRTSAPNNMYLTRYWLDSINIRNMTRNVWGKNLGKQNPVIKLNIKFS